LAYTIAVILWGALVRATGSGAGCGNHWPLCNGEILPRPERIETLIEFVHRGMTGLLLPLAILMAIWIYRRYGQGAQVRRTAGWSLFFLLTESLIGAGLVRLELVADNASAGRAFAVSLHLINTFLLLAALALTAWLASGGPAFYAERSNPRFWFLTLGLLGVLVLAASGAVTALGDTLFPAATLAEGLRQDMSEGSNFLIRLRVFHPLLAIFVGLYTGLTTSILGPLGDRSPAGRLALGLVILITGQLGLGLLNVLLLAPIWLQITHLFVSDLIWIFLVLFTATSLVEQTAPASAVDPISQVSQPV
jgi:heme A synthase